MPARVVIVPSMTVARPHRREAFRALLGQGAPRDALTDDVLDRVLWLARALPVVIDVIDELPLADVRLQAATFERLGAVPDRGPVVVLAWRNDGEDVVEVLGLSPDALAARAWEMALVRITVQVSVPSPDDVIPTGPDARTDTEPTVRIQRFTLG
jgi:hypothetical protein